MYEKLNVEPIEIEYYGEKPYFRWDGVRCFLSDFICTHNNPWTVGTHFPDYIHAYEANDYYNPLFIELIGDEAVNVYREVRDDND